MIDDLTQTTRVPYIIRIKKSVAVLLYSEYLSNKTRCWLVWWIILGGICDSQYKSKLHIKQISVEVLDDWREIFRNSL